MSRHQPRSDRPETQARIVAVMLELVDKQQIRFDSIAADHGLTPAQAQTLMRLETPSPMREIAEALGCDASNVTGIVARLSARGLVTRTPDDRDRRVRQLALTDDGQAMRGSMRAALLANNGDLGPIEEFEERQLLELLRKLNAAPATGQAAETG